MKGTPKRQRLISQWLPDRKSCARSPGLQDNSPRKRPESQAGFTLIEVLVVLVIIGLIMGLAAPRVLNYLASSKEKAAHLQVKALSAAVDLYYLDMGRYPTTSEGLQALVKKPATTNFWGGPYLKDAVIPADPWGRPYVYRMPGRQNPYGIVSFGPSGQEGAADNISSEQP